MSATRINALVAKAKKEISDVYILRHPKSSFSLHTNQHIAMKISLLDSALSTEDLETSLIDCYLELPNTKGDLARLIEDFFSETLRKSLTQPIIVANLASGPLGRIARRTIGAPYLHEFPKRDFFGFHTNQDIAKRISELPDNITAAELETKLINYYLELPNFNGKLAHSIQTFFRDHLKKPITQQMLINNLSLDFIKKIGSDYLAKYPVQITSGFFKHTNQHLARAMSAGVEYSTNTPITIDSTHSLWNYLLKIYELLPFNNGLLANRIESVFKKAFAVTFDGMKAVDNTRVSKHLTRIEMADDVKRTITPKINEASGAATTISPRV
jgi:hypothetical protein